MSRVSRGSGYTRASGWTDHDSFYAPTYLTPDIQRRPNETELARWRRKCKELYERKRRMLRFLRNPKRPPLPRDHPDARPGARDTIRQALRRMDNRIQRWCGQYLQLRGGTVRSANRSIMGSRASRTSSSSSNSTSSYSRNSRFTNRPPRIIEWRPQQRQWGQGSQASALTTPNFSVRSTGSSSSSSSSFRRPPSVARMPSRSDRSTSSSSKSVSFDTPPPPVVVRVTGKRKAAEKIPIKKTSKRKRTLNKKYFGDQWNSKPIKGYSIDSTIEELGVIPTALEIVEAPSVRSADSLSMQSMMSSETMDA